MENTAEELETTLKRVEKKMRLERKLEKIMDKYVPPGVPAEQGEDMGKVAFVPPGQLGPQGMPPQGMPMDPSMGGTPPQGMPADPSMAGAGGAMPAQPGMPPQPMPGPQLPPGLQMDTATGLLVDTVTGTYIDPGTGMPIDPATGQPMQQAGAPAPQPGPETPPGVAAPAELAEAEPAPTEDFERRLSTVEKGLSKVLEILESQQDAQDGGAPVESMGGPAQEGDAPPGNPAAMAPQDGLGQMPGPFGPGADAALAGMDANSVGTLQGFSKAVKDAQRRKQQGQ